MDDQDNQIDSGKNLKDEVKEALEQESEKPGTSSAQKY